MKKITIATLKNGLSLFFTLWNIESAANPTKKTIALGKYLYQSGRAMGYYDMPPEDVRDWTDGFSLLNK